MTITEKIIDLQRSLPQGVTLVAISKTHPTEMIQQAYVAGQRVFGENRPQELKSKYEQLPKDIQWHMIGNMQTNKIRIIAPFISMIHSIDSQKLLELINKEAKRCDRIIDVLMEVHVAREVNKNGWLESDLMSYLDTGEYRGLDNIRVRGVMGMATYTDDITLIRTEFNRLRTIFENMQKVYFDGDKYFDTLSMGMTSDYRIAIECGATMVRLGSLIFGERDYTKKE